MEHNSVSGVKLKMCAEAHSQSVTTGSSFSAFRLFCSPMPEYWLHYAAAVCEKWTFQWQDGYSIPWLPDAAPLLRVPFVTALLSGWSLKTK